MKARFKKKRMRSSALNHWKDYFYKRFSRVVASGKKSTMKEVLSGVPQGDKASPPFLDFDISQMPDLLSDFVLFFGYADDVALWYEISPENKQKMTKIINDDLSALKA